MLFDSRRQGNLNFKFGQTDILSVDFHKHLGIVFSSDGKWTRHIDYILSKASKQVCVLRKLKFILKQEILEINYLTFIRPLLKYSCEVWGNCSQTNNDKLEKLQLEAARIVTGLTVYSSRDSLYQETGWGKLSSRRERRKLCLMYNMYHGHAPILSVWFITSSCSWCYQLPCSKQKWLHCSKMSLIVIPIIVHPVS
jgi:hypothetical protein